MIVCGKNKFRKGGTRMLGEMKCAGVAGRLSRVLLEESSEQRIEGGKECAMRLSGGTGLRKE